jgi:hypothetical protein
MAQGSTQPVTEMSTRNLPGGKGWPALKADNLSTTWEPCRLTTAWACMIYYRDSFTFFFFWPCLSNPRHANLSTSTLCRGGCWRRTAMSALLWCELI